jgi:hypothetical protein
VLQGTINELAVSNVVQSRVNKRFDGQRHHINIVFTGELEDGVRLG